MTKVIIGKINGLDKDGKQEMPGIVPHFEQLPGIFDGYQDAEKTITADGWYTIMPITFLTAKPSQNATTQATDSPNKDQQKSEGDNAGASGQEMGDSQERGGSGL